MPTLRIKLGNRLVGTITNVVTDKNIFVFDPGYVAASTSAARYSA